MSIEGIPDGWELVAFREASEGEYFLNNEGKIEKWTLGRKSGVRLAIIRKIEKPKRYRPFANAAEFEPHRERWVRYVGDNDCNENNRAKVGAYCDKTVTIGHDQDTWDYHFNNYVFDDGTPFGIEVTE